MPRSLVTALEIIAALFALAGAYTVWEAVLMQGGSAPQQAALAAMGVGVAAIPYFIAAMAHRAYMRRAASLPEE